MKRYFLLALLSISGASCIRGGEVEEVHLAPFSIPEMVEDVIKILFKTQDPLIALKTFKSWAETNKELWNLFRSQERSRNFIYFLHKISSESNFDISSLYSRNVLPLLNKKLGGQWHEGIKKRDGLKNVIESCAQSSEWPVFLESFAALASDSFGKALINSHWSEHFLNCPAKSNFLLKLIQSKAPSYVLSSCIKSGVSKRWSHPSTPSPLLVLCKELIDQNMLNQQGVEDLDLQALLEGNELSVTKFSDFKEKLELFLDKNNLENNPLNDSFCTTSSKQFGYTYFFTPLSLAAENYYLKMIEDLKALGARMQTPHPIVAVAEEFLNGKNKNLKNIIRALVRAAQNNGILQKTLISLMVHERHCLFDKVLQLKMQEHNLTKEDLRSLLLLFFEEADIDATEVSSSGESALELALIHEDKELIELFSKKGRFSLSIDKKKNNSSFLMGQLGVFFYLCTNTQNDIQVLQSEAQKLFSTAQKFIEEDALETSALFPLIGVALDFPFSKECLSTLEFLAKQEPWTFEFTGYETASSVFDAFVLILSKQKQNPPAYSQLLKNALYLISLLSEKGIKDRTLPHGKTAAERAQDLGLKELAEGILHPTKEWADRLQSLDTQDEAKTLFAEVTCSLLAGTTTIAAASEVLFLAPLYLYLEEAKLLLKHASACKPFIMRGWSFGDNATVLHIIAFCAYTLKQQGCYGGFLEKGGGDLILWLLQEGITDRKTDNGITAYDIAAELELPQIASLLTGAYKE